MKNNDITPCYFKYSLTLIVIAFCSFSCSVRYKIIKSTNEEISIIHQENTLSGTLLLPNEKAPFPLVIFIHGDGPQDRFANESYTVLINNFLQNGIAVFSWDKQGIGKSTGNWLHQSMKMRAEEAIIVMKHLKKRIDIKDNSVGFIGFSQAGWVLPEMAKITNDMAYLIIVGGAINWMEQKDFFESNQLKTTRNLQQEEVSAARKIFINLNKNADAKEGLRRITVPFLGILGEKDLNVNSANTIAVYDSIFKEVNHQDYLIIMFPNATHALLNADNYNFIGKWPLKAKLQYVTEGEKAYALGFLELLIKWIQKH